MAANPTRENWSSMISFVWVSAGAAVGLGNVWKFPYMAGSKGGSAFVLMYLFFVVAIAIPVMVAEIMLGKLSKRNAVDGFAFLARISNRTSAWRATGYLGTFTLFLIFCFYSVVAGWSLAYLKMCASNAFYQQSPGQIQQMWLSFLADPQTSLICAFLFILSTMAIVFFGVKKGIEKACTMMMPALLLVLVVLVIFSSTSGGFSQALDFLFSFEPGKISAGVVVASLGHALFTLAVGACAMMVYGSYLPKDASVIKSVFLIALLDVIVAMLAGLAIFPLIFEWGLSPEQGPGLMFASLPIVFAQLPLGWFWGSLFFVLIFFAALSSSLSFAEPIVDLVISKTRFKRGAASFLVGILTFTGSILCALSFNLLADLKLFGRWTIFDFIAELSTNLLLPVGGIAIAIFAGLVIKSEHLGFLGRPYGRLMFKMWRIVMLFIAPVSMVAVIANGMIELF